MKVPHPLNAKEQYLYAINTKLDTLIDLLTQTQEEQAPKPEPKPAPRKARAKKEA